MKVKVFSGFLTFWLTEYPIRDVLWLFEHNRSSRCQKAGKQRLLCQIQLDRSLHKLLHVLTDYHRGSTRASAFLYGAEHHLLVQNTLFNTRLIGRLPLQPLMTDNDVQT